MKSYLAAFACTILAIFMIVWAFIRLDYEKIATSDYWLTKPHSNLIKKCDLGDVVIIGDSTAVADVIPSRIGPGVRDLGYNGGTPVEAYYIAQSILNCSHRPKAVIVSFVPGKFRSAAIDNGGSYFWEAFKYNVVDFSDALQVLKVSRKINDKSIAGPVSLFDIDFRVKAFLYSIKFPAYYSTDLETYVSGRLQNAKLTNPSLNAMFYNQGILDDGHHFIGTKASEENTVDSDAYRPEQPISPVADFYLRRMIESFASNGIPVYFIEPPRDRISAVHYLPGVMEAYQSYLTGLQLTEPNFHIIGNGRNIWDPTLFGDFNHLNLRGALILSDNIREELNAAGKEGLTFSDADVQPVNLYDAKSNDEAFWKQTAPGDSAKISPAPNIPLPALAHPGGSAWLYSASAEDGGNKLAGIQAPDINLSAKTNYAASVFVKNIDADDASLKLNWPGGAKGSVTWDFKQRQIGYSGTANPLNSGVTLCPGGWVQLFLSAVTGPSSISYSGPVVSLSAKHDALAYFFNPTLEHGLWPTNYCPLQPGEAGTATSPPVP